MITELQRSQFPKKLLEIPDPPDTLYLRGSLPSPDTKTLCVVGARSYTQYGKDNCEQLVASLKGKDICIVSGLALGIDTIAHKAALAAGLHTVAIPGSGISPDVLYPHTNRQFAEKIVEAGGGILSEFEPDFVSAPWAFPKRNRIMAGISDAILIIEAEQKSGTLITARLAADYNRDVLVVPGSVFSKNSGGPHLLLRLGATPITCPADLHETLGFEVAPEDKKEKYADCSPAELQIVELLQDAMPRDELAARLKLPAHELSILISLLEMKGYIREFLGELRLI